MCNHDFSRHVQTQSGSRDKLPYTGPAIKALEYSFLLPRSDIALVLNADRYGAFGSFNLKRYGALWNRILKRILE